MARKGSNKGTKAAPFGRYGKGYGKLAGTPRRGFSKAAGGGKIKSSGAGMSGG